MVKDYVGQAGENSKGAFFDAVKILSALNFVVSAAFAIETDPNKASAASIHTVFMLSILSISKDIADRNRCRKAVFHSQGVCSVVRQLATMRLGY